MEPKKIKRIAQKAGAIDAARTGRGELIPTGDLAPFGNRTFQSSTVTGDALQNRIAQARARTAGNEAPFVQTQARTAARDKIQRFATANPGSAAVRSVPGVNVNFGALSGRVDLLKPQIPSPRLVIERSLPSPFLQKGR